MSPMPSACPGPLDYHPSPARAQRRADVEGDGPTAGRTPASRGPNYSMARTTIEPIHGSGVEPMSRLLTGPLRET